MHEKHRLESVPISVLVGDKVLAGEYVAQYCFDCKKVDITPSVPDTSKPAVEIRFRREDVLRAWGEGRSAL
jgi:hypothetical protein